MPHERRSAILPPMSEPRPKGSHFSHADLKACIELLGAVAGDRSVLMQFEEEDVTGLLNLAGRVAFPTRTERRQLNKAHRKKARIEQKKRDLGLMRRTQMRSAQPIVTPEQRLRFLPPPEARPTE